MRSTIALVLAVASLASAQIQDLPKCASACFTKAIASTSCAPTDAHCACTTGAKDFMKVAIPCLCEAGCSVADLKKVETTTNNLCAAALSAKGEDYTSATLDPKVCQAIETGKSSATASLTSVTATATATATKSAAATGSATGTASATESATGTETAAPESTGGASVNGFMVEGVLVSMALLGLVLV